MNLILDTLAIVWWILFGIAIGFYLNKDKVKETIKGVGSVITTVLIKPQGTVIDSKEENSLNRVGDEVNYHHNSYFDEEL